MSGSELALFHSLWNFAWSGTPPWIHPVGDDIDVIMSLPDFEKLTMISSKVFEKGTAWSLLIRIGGL